MNKPWLGYLSSAFLLLAGVFMIAGNKLLLGCLFIGLAILGVILRLYMRNK
jgi:hypothetical protein